MNDRPIVLIGLMGAGKTSVGNRLAEVLGLEFVDSDDEIVEAAGCSIPEIFDVYGEQAFRDCEEKVISRLLNSERRVVATGGGAFMNERTRKLVADKALSIWLRADLDILVERTGRRGGRPLLEKGDPRQTLQRLMDERYPVYAEADLIVDTGIESKDFMVRKIVDALDRFSDTSTLYHN